MPRRPPGAEEGNVQVIGGDEATLRQFFVHHYASLSYARGQTTMYIGQLPPEQEAAQIPIPVGCRVIGSIVSENEQIEVLLATSIPPEEAVIVCERTVLKAEWKFVEEWLPGPAVFLDSERIPPRIFCKENADTVLTVNVGKAPGTTAIRLSTHPQAHPCVPILSHQSEYFQFLPSLQTPPKARLLTYSGSGGGGESGSHYSAIAT